MSLVSKIVTGVVGVGLSCVLLLFSLAFTHLEIDYRIVGALAVLHIAAVIFCVGKEQGSSGGLETLALLAPAFVVLTGFLAYVVVTPLLIAYAPDREFAAACRGTGVHILHAPAAPVNSIGLDWYPETGDDGPRSVYRLGLGGLLKSVVLSPPYPEMLVGAAQADVVITHAASNSPQDRQLIRYTLTATDSRDGVQLATMAFAIDTSKYHACGANAGDAIDVAAFMKQATLFEGQNSVPNGAAPVHEVVPEVLETQAYSPVRVLDQDEWSRLTFDDEHTRACETTLPKISSYSWQRRFARDVSGRRRMLPAPGAAILLCDDGGILSGSYAAGRDGEAVELDRYSVDGRLLYKVAFKKPPELGGYGVLLDPTLTSAGGFLTFEWWNASQHGDKWLVSRRMKLRIREPAPAA